MLLKVNGFGKQESTKPGGAAPQSQIRWNLLVRMSLLLWAFFFTSWIAQRAMH